MLHRSYRRELKVAMYTIRFGKGARKKSKVAAAKRSVTTIANALLCDVLRNLPDARKSALHEDPARYSKIINQQ